MTTAEAGVEPGSMDSVDAQAVGWRRALRFNPQQRTTRGAWRNFRSSRSAMIGLALVVFHAGVAVVAPLAAPYDPTAINPSIAFQDPSWSHPFGTDQIGRDVLSRVMHGGRFTLGIVLVAVTIAVFAGGALGMSVAYVGGIVDEISMRVVDAIIAIPYTLALLVIVTAFEPKLTIITAALAIHYAPGVARASRAAALGIIPRDFITAARARGERTLSIVARELRPNTMDVLLVEFALRASWAILLMSTLSFLGFGVQPPTPDWGVMVQENNHFMALAPWVTIFPVIAISTVVIGLNLVADGIAKAVGLDLATGAPE